jgi:hypothetical protein
VHALQQEKLMTECQVLSVQSGPSLKAAAKGQEQGSEEYEHSLHPNTPRRKFNAFNENGLPGRDNVFIDLDVKRQGDLLGDSRTAPAGITLLHGDDRINEFCTRSFRAGLPTAIW